MGKRGHEPRLTGRHDIAHFIALGAKQLLELMSIETWDMGVSAKGLQKEREPELVTLC